MTREAIYKWFEGDDWQYESGWSKVQPLIRCKDCKHWHCDDSESYCDELGIFDTDMNSYCSYAKRREE